MSAKRNSRKTQAGVREETKQKKFRLLLVDDHPIVREGLVSVFESTPNFEVCGLVETVRDALTATKTAAPDVVIADMTLAGRNGMELIKDLRVLHPRMPVIIYSMHDESIHAERCLRAGAKGYVMKDAPAQTLLDAIDRVLRGEVYLSEAVTKQVLEKFSLGKRVRGTSPPELLSDRELEIFQLIGRGLRTKEIAFELSLSDKTVQTHRERIKEKLNLSDAVSLVRCAVQWMETQR